MFFLKRSEIADQKYFKERSIGRKRLTTLAFQFELKNNNSFPIEFELVDQVPVSQTKSAEVEIEEFSGAMIDEETGEVIWKLDLNPTESIEKKLIFTIESDGNFSFSKGKARMKYRTVSCPTF